MKSSCWLDESLSSTTNVLFHVIYKLLNKTHINSLSAFAKIHCKEQLKLTIHCYKNGLWETLSVIFRYSNKSLLLVFCFDRNEKTSVKQDSNPKWVHIFSFRVKFTSLVWNCHWWQINYQWTYCLIYVFSESPFKMVSGIRSLLKFTPIRNCHWWQIKYWQIYVFSDIPFETAQIYSSRLLLRFTHKFYPPFETVIDGTSNIGRSMSSVRAHVKLLKFSAQVYSSSLLLKFTPQVYM